jgi:hypothetical protein
MSLGTVFWEDTGHEREVTGFCERCQRSVSQGNHTRRMSDYSDVMIVSPSGLAHAGHEIHHERTACGLDATGPDWWWRL